MQPIKICAPLTRHDDRGDAEYAALLGHKGIASQIVDAQIKREAEVREALDLIAQFRADLDRIPNTVAIPAAAVLTMRSRRRLARVIRWLVVPLTIALVAGLVLMLAGCGKGPFDYLPFPVDGPGSGDVGESGSDGESAAFADVGSASGTSGTSGAGSGSSGGSSGAISDSSSDGSSGTHECEAQLEPYTPCGLCGREVCGPGLECMGDAQGYAMCVTRCETADDCLPSGWPMPSHEVTCQATPGAVYPDGEPAGEQAWCWPPCAKVDICPELAGQLLTCSDLGGEHPVCVWGPVL